MHATIKDEIKQGAQRRREERVALRSAGQLLHFDTAEKDMAPTSPSEPPIQAAYSNSPAEILPNASAARPGPIPPVSTSDDAKSATSSIFRHSDAILFSFFLETLLPFLYPFYRPSILVGGKSWLLEMATNSQEMRRAIFSQSAYFLTLAREIPYGDRVWANVINRTEETFEILQASMAALRDPAMDHGLLRTVRVLASIIQVQRFDIAIMSFENCRAHLSAACAVFTRLLPEAENEDAEAVKRRFDLLMAHLGPEHDADPTDPCFRTPSAEQTALRFSATLLLFDDIIASTVLQQPPKLYRYHLGLLRKIHDKEPLLDMATLMGCQNWAICLLGEVAVMSAWKQKCMNKGDLSVAELIGRGEMLRISLTSQLSSLENAHNPGDAVNNYNILEAFAMGHRQRVQASVTNSVTITKLWAHATRIWLLTIVSGWRPSDTTVCRDVDAVIKLLTCHLEPPILLRAAAWPFCVAGCIAQPSRHAQFREFAHRLQPARLFGSVHKALEIMERVWSIADTEEIQQYDMASWFNTSNELVLLV